MHDYSAIELQEIIAAELVGAPFLLWRTEDGKLQLDTLDGDRWQVTIGRDSGADICLGWDPQVSRSHALLERRGNGWTLIDDGSKNGSFVKAPLEGRPGWTERKRVDRHRLAERECVCLGVTELTYREPPPISSEPPHPDSPSTVVTPKGIVPSDRLPPRRREVLIALCRPVFETQSPVPATNRQIADEVFLTVDAVKSHLRGLFERYGISDVPQNEKRARLVAYARLSGDVTKQDF